MRPKPKVLAIVVPRGCRGSQPRPIEIRYSESDYFCRPVKIRVTAIPASKAARSPHIFAAGIALIKPQAVLRSLEPPPPLRGPAGKVCQPIDWRVSGDQDPPPEEV